MQGCRSDAPQPMPTHTGCSLWVRSSPHSKLMPFSLLGIAFLKWVLSSFCLFLFAVLREVGEEQPSGSLLSGCLFGRKQKAEGRCLKEKKNLNLSGNMPSEKMKSRRAQDEETHRESLGCVSNRLTVTDHRKNSPAIDDGSICLCRLLARQSRVIVWVERSVGGGAYQNKWWTKICKIVISPSCFWDVDAHLAFRLARVRTVYPFWCACFPAWRCPTMSGTQAQDKLQDSLCCGQFYHFFYSFEHPFWGGKQRLESTFWPRHSSKQCWLL